MVRFAERAYSNKDLAPNASGDGRIAELLAFRSHP